MPFATVTGDMLAQSKPLAGPSGEETAIAGIEQAFVATSSHRLAAEAEILPPLVARRTPDSVLCQNINHASKPGLLPFKHRKRYPPARSAGRRSALGLGMLRTDNAPAPPSAGRSDGDASVMRQSWPISTRLGC